MQPADGVDVAVVKRPAKLADRDRVEMPLLREIVFPVCAPSILDSQVPLRSLHELVGHTLIESDAAEADDTEFTWSSWLSRFGLQQAQMGRQLRFSHFGLALSAAIDGLGIALGRSPMVDAELASGRLVRPFGGNVMAKASDVFALAWRDTDAGVQDQRIRRLSRLCVGRSVRVRTGGRSLRDACLGEGCTNARSVDVRTSGASRDGG